MNQGGGLQLPKELGISGKIQQEIHGEWDTFGVMQDDLEQRGFGPVGKPDFQRPVLTPDILATINGSGISELYTKVSAWQAYANDLFSRIRGGITQVQNEMHYLSIELRGGLIRARSNAKEKKPTKDDIQAAIELNPRYKELVLELQKLEQQRFIMEGHVDSLNRMLRVVSRQIELRRQELEGNVGGRGYADHPTGRGMRPGRL